MVTVAGVTAVAIKVEAAVEPEATAVAGVATKQAIASFARAQVKDQLPPNTDS